jgi:hypothetical protein
VTVQVELPGAFTVPGEQLKVLGTTVTVTVRPTVVDWLCPLSVAVMVAVWAAVMVPLIAVNVALLCPDGTVTLGGTGKLAVLLPSETTAALAAALFRDTVQVVVALLARVDGEHDTEVNCAGALAVIVNVWEPPFRLAVSSAVWLVLTEPTLAVKEPLVWFAAIPMLPGTVTMPLPLVNPTVTPPEVAGPDNVTVQVELPGAFTVPGEQLRLLGTTVTVRLTLVNWLVPLRLAVMVAVWLLPITPLVAVNVALLCPDGTVTLAGTGKLALLLLSDTTMALVAFLLSDTVQVVLALLARVDGEHDTPVNCAGAGAARLSVNVCAPPPVPAVTIAL